MRSFILNLLLILFFMMVVALPIIMAYEVNLDTVCQNSLNNDNAYARTFTGRIQCHIDNEVYILNGTFRLEEGGAE